MILNAYAILDGLVSLLRLGLALPVIWLAWSSWRRWRLARNAAERDPIEDRFYLLVLLAGLLLSLNVLSWPLLYLLLQSYVPEWPDVMCIYGVTRIGSGSVGSSRHLPPLLMALQGMKPLLVFLSGTVFALHLVNRRTRTAPFTGRIFLGLMAVGLLATLDAAAELTYLAIPKKEEFLSSGCCTSLFEREHGPSRFVPPQMLGSNAADWLVPTYYAGNAAAVAAFLGAVWMSYRRKSSRWLFTIIPTVAVAALLLNWVFLTEVAAPRLVHQPNHHCPYDLVSRAPGSVAAVVLFVGATFSAGWACCIESFGRGLEPRSAVDRLVRAFLLAAAVAESTATVVLSILLASS